MLQKKVWLWYDLAMTSWELRNKFLKFFERNNHKVIPSSSLVPKDEEQLSGKSKVLFTSAGMQPLIPYLMGADHPDGKRLVNIQKCLRTDDISEVGDLTHHTFFEMLGSWSLGDYFKEEAIKLSFKFLTEELEIPREKLAISVFAGGSDALRDEESAKIWQSLGIPKERIFYLDKTHNWWPSGEASGPCGPDTEMFIWTGKGNPEGSPETNNLWVEIWNNVFMQFNRKEDKSLEPLKQKNVDTGMGFERTLAVLNGLNSSYDTDLFEDIIRSIEEITKTQYGREGESDKKIRIIADHMRSATFILSEGVEPSNKERGYILRRLIRRAITLAYLLNPQDSSLAGCIDVSIHKYNEQYPELLENREKTIENYRAEEGKFKKLLISGLSKLEKEIRGMEKASQFSGKLAFDLYQNHGIPVDLTIELLKEKGLELNQDEYRAEFKKHQETSRANITQKFAGGLAGHSETEIKYHTATHLLHQALRDVLGPSVFQKGSNINQERLRFDYSYDKKPTSRDIEKVEEIINQKIREKLNVKNKTISIEEARALNAIGLFDNKYQSEVSIYTIGPSYTLNPEAKDQRFRGNYYSVEFCGGPHVKNTAKVGGIKILKDESIALGIRRIRAILA